MMSPDVVDVWTATASGAWREAEPPARWLSADERARAQRILHGPSRCRFVAGRALLRRLLAWYTDAAPAEVVFEYGRYGKPRLVGVGADVSTRFSISHSGDLLAVAITQGRDVGIDVEGLRATVPGTEASLLSDAELRRARSLPADARLRWFFRIFTQKEAVAKALGVGVRAVPEVDLDEAAFSCHELALPVPFVGAVAAEGDRWQSRPHRWNWREAHLPQ